MVLLRDAMLKKRKADEDFIGEATEEARIREGRPIRSFTDDPALIGDLGVDPVLPEPIENIRARTPEGRSYWEGVPDVQLGELGGKIHDMPDKPDPFKLVDKKTVPERPSTVDITDFSETIPEDVHASIRNRFIETTGVDPLEDPYERAEKALATVPNPTKDDTRKAHQKAESEVATAKQNYDVVKRMYNDRYKADVLKKKDAKTLRDKGIENAEKKEAAAQKDYRNLGAQRIKWTTKHRELQGLLQDTFETDKEYDPLLTEIDMVNKQLDLIARGMGDLEREYNFKPAEPIKEEGAQEYKTPEEIRDAFKAGKITRDQAKQFYLQLTTK